MTNLPLVSVIIPTLNEEKNIGRCLESIRKQTYPKDKIEIIVVDNDSTDKTREIVRKLQKPGSSMVQIIPLFSQKKFGRKREDLMKISQVQRIGILTKE